jgi:hypothetical protein
MDYTWSAAASALAQTVDAPNTRTMLRAAAGAGTVTSLMTNYEAGLVRVMPMKGHLAMDLVLGAALLAAPFFLPRAERRYAALPLLFGAVGLVTGLLTQTTSPTEHEASLTLATA